MQRAYDVIVIGGGGSGLAAALSAAEHGLSVLLLEKRPVLGGSTGIAVGSFTASRTSYQAKAGIVDNPDDHEADAGLFGPPEVQQRNNATMRRFFMEHSARTLDWLHGLGLQFHGPSPEPPNRVPRMHNVVPNAKAYIAILQSRFLQRRGTILCNANVENLVKRDGAVVGVEVRVAGRTVRCDATCGVVLAAGDYANSSEMIARFKGPQFACIEGINVHATGDGHRLAEKAGAPLVNMDVTYGPELRFIPPPRKPFTQLLPARGPIAWAMGLCLPLAPQWLLNRMIKRLLVTWQHPENALFDDGTILLNARGERFCNECRSPEREIAIAKQPDKIAYLLLDRRVAERYGKWPHFISTAPEIAYAHVQDYRRMRPDVTVMAETLDEIAAARKMPADVLRTTVEQFNRFARGEAADPQGRSERVPALVDGGWVLLGPAKAYFTTTEGAPAINTRLQVLDADDRPIPGLYAVGQNGLGGMVLWGHGLHIGWALTSGRLVGAVLAEAKGQR